jgi:hypothetical protein
MKGVQNTGVQKFRMSAPRTGMGVSARNSPELLQLLNFNPKSRNFSLWV